MQRNICATWSNGKILTFNSPAQAIAAACTLRERLGDLGLQVRCGVRSGEVEWRRQNVAGIDVHVAARIAAKATAGSVLVIETAARLCLSPANPTWSTRIRRARRSSRLLTAIAAVRPLAGADPRRGVSCGGVVYGFPIRAVV